MTGIAPVIREFVAGATKGFADRLAAIEVRAPEKGDAGVAGKDGVPGAAGERGEKGEPGQVGKDGVPGAVGDRGEKGDAGVAGKDADPALIERMVAAAVAKLPAAINGKDGPPGRDGQPGVPGRDGSPGSDGLGIEDAEIDYDGERTIIVRLSRGDRVKESKIVLPIVIDRGVWQARAFERGDGVSWKGSFWIARRDTSASPAEGSRDWRLAVKRGRDGRDAIPPAKVDD